MTTTTLSSCTFLLRNRQIEDLRSQKICIIEQQKICISRQISQSQKLIDKSRYRFLVIMLYRQTLNFYNMRLQLISKVGKSMVYVLTHALYCEIQKKQICHFSGVYNILAILYLQQKTVLKYFYRDIYHRMERYRDYIHYVTMDLFVSIALFTIFCT